MNEINRDVDEVNKKNDNQFIFSNTAAILFIAGVMVVLLYVSVGCLSVLFFVYYVLTQ